MIFDTDPIEEEDDYLGDDGIEIHSEVFDKDFDDINFDGELDSDEDDDAAELFGY